MSERQTLNAGFGTSCSVQAKGELWCWGSLPDNYGSGDYPVRMYPENDSPEFTSISAGAGFGCGVVSNGSIACFGSEAIKKILLPGFGTTETVWKEVSVGLQHACGIQSNGEAYCWGFCGTLECGPLEEAGTTDQQQTYVRIPNSADGPWLQIDTSMIGQEIPDLSSHTCAIKLNSSAWCWGDNRFGQLGYGSNARSDIPMLVSGGYSWKEVCTGQGYSCGVTVDGLLLCWGVKIPIVQYSTAGTTFEIYGTVPTLVDPLQQQNTTYESITCGSQHACVIESTTKRAYCWGDNKYGQLGDLSTQESNIPVMVQENASSPFYNIPDTWIEISAGSAYTCGRKPQNEVACWGSTMNGQLGIGVQNTRAVLAPVIVTTLLFNATDEISVPLSPSVVAPAPEILPDPLDSLPPVPEPLVSLPASAPEILPVLVAPAPLMPVPENITETDQGSSSSIGAIVGGVVGGLVVLALAGFLIWFLIKRRRRSKEASPRSKEPSISSETTDDISRAEEGQPEDETVPEIPVDAGVVSMLEVVDSKDDAMPLDRTSPQYPLESETFVGEEEREMEDIPEFGVQDGDEEIGEDVKDEANIESEGTPFSTFKPELPQIRNFDTVVIQKKLNFTRSRSFLSLHQRTKHFDRAAKPASQKDGDSSSWYYPRRIFSKQDINEHMAKYMDNKSIEQISEIWESGGREEREFLQEYVGKVYGLHMTRQVLDSWPEESSKASLSESCNNISIIIEDIRLVLWDLAMTKSPFHIRRKKFNISWDESGYLKVYESVQRVLLQTIQNVINVISRDERYVCVQGVHIKIYAQNFVYFYKKQFCADFLQDRLISFWMQQI